MRTRSLRNDALIPPDRERTLAEIEADALQGNYHAISKLVPGQAILPMIKADAYGHGAGWAAKMLLGLPALYGFGVATLEEGKKLRHEVGPRGRRARVFVFSGSALWSEEKGDFCESNGLAPVISSEEDWKKFVSRGWAGRIPYAIKFNTGMNRLGLSPSSARQVARDLAKLPADAHPELVLSHLALAEKPDARLSLQQRERFESIRRELSGALPSSHFSLANSSAIWNAKHWRLDGLTDVIRPGLSLYGVPPWPGAPARGIRPAMTWKARVIQVRTLQPGESIGYGATFTVPAGAEATRVAIVSAGYADGVHRTLSSTGHAWLNGAPTRFVGRVSMDLSAVRCPGPCKAGDWLELLGEHVDPWAQAEAAGSIPYELLTSVSRRVERVYG